MTTVCIERNRDVLDSSPFGPRRDAETENEITVCVFINFKPPGDSEIT